MSPTLVRLSALTLIVVFAPAIARAQDVPTTASEPAATPIPSPAFEYRPTFKTSPQYQRGARLRIAGIALIGLGTVLTFVGGLTLLGNGVLYNDPDAYGEDHPRLPTIGGGITGAGVGAALIGGILLGYGYRDMDAARERNDVAVVPLAQVSF